MLSPEDVLGRKSPATRCYPGPATTEISVRDREQIILSRWSRPTPSIPVRFAEVRMLGLRSDNLMCTVLGLIIDLTFGPAAMNGHGSGACERHQKLKSRFAETKWPIVYRFTTIQG